MTPRYHAPERAELKPCGRPEDLFALGCTFLEMGIRVVKADPNIHLRIPSTERRWSFQANLNQKELWLATFRSDNQLAKLGELMNLMLEYDRGARPPIGEVIEWLRTPHWSNEVDFFGPCCGGSKDTPAYGTFEREKLQEKEGDAVPSPMSHGGVLSPDNGHSTTEWADSPPESLGLDLDYDFLNDRGDIELDSFSGATWAVIRKPTVTSRQTQATKPEEIN
ncbi:hypothetical protein EK21DRAFT_116771 [Setomelanomma holmii]|uniref:Protein kinase domain-containing protein n=1 Tax=Setomelanomma holmii TaxID=210430 RepID=A0A9P4LHI4_9PLEO|nr:hypothetical protein EK21DRAFT_116771 [Setomelanomma holmii]